MGQQDYLTENEVGRLLQQPNKSTFLGMRNYLIILLLLNGVLLPEIPRIRVYDFDTEGYVYFLLTRKPKFKIRRKVILSDSVKEAMREYLTKPLGGKR